MGPVLPPRRPDPPGCDTGEERGSDSGADPGADPGEAGLLEVEGFRLAFEDSALGMSIEDLDGRFTQVNASLCSMLGYERDGLIGQPYSKVCHPDDLEDDTHLAGLRNGWIPRY